MSLCCLGSPQVQNTAASVSQEAEITGTIHRAQLLFFMSPVQQEKTMCPSRLAQESIYESQSLPVRDIMEVSQGNTLYESRNTS